MMSFVKGILIKHLRLPILCLVTRFRPLGKSTLIYNQKQGRPILMSKVVLLLKQQDNGYTRIDAKSPRYYKFQKNRLLYATRPLEALLVGVKIFHSSIFLPLQPGNYDDASPFNGAVRSP